MSQPSIFHYFWPGKGVKPTYDFFDPIKRCKGGILKEILISYGESRDLLIVDGSTSIYDIFKYFGDLNKSFSSSFQRMASKGSLLWKLQESYMDIDFQFYSRYLIQFSIFHFVYFLFGGHPSRCESVLFLIKSLCVGSYYDYLKLVLNSNSLTLIFYS